MAPYWEPGTQYNIGSVVEYEGAEYKIIQAHFSQGDWTPPVTPALWGRLQGGDNSHDRQPRREEVEYKEEVVVEEQHKNSFFGVEMSEEAEHKLKIGGGLALGAALLGGGIAAYKHHKDKEHQQHQQHGEVREYEEVREEVRDY